MAQPFLRPAPVFFCWFYNGLIMVSYWLLLGFYLVQYWFSIGLPGVFNIGLTIGFILV